jgi:hypothetical protein
MDNPTFTKHQTLSPLKGLRLCIAAYPALSRWAEAVPHRLRRRFPIWQTRITEC